MVTISDKSESDRSKYFLFKLVDIAILCTFMHWCEYWAEPLAETLVIWLRHSLNALNCFSIYIDSMAQIKDLARWRWNSSKWNIRQIGWKTEVNFTSHFLPVPAQPRGIYELMDVVSFKQIYILEYCVISACSCIILATSESGPRVYILMQVHAFWGVGVIMHTYDTISCTFSGGEFNWRSESDIRCQNFMKFRVPLDESESRGFEKDSLMWSFAQNNWNESGEGIVCHFWDQYRALLSVLGHLNALGGCIAGGWNPAQAVAFKFRLTL